MLASLHEGPTHLHPGTATPTTPPAAHHQALSGPACAPCESGTPAGRRSGTPAPHPPPPPAAMPGHASIICFIVCMFCLSGQERMTQDPRQAVPLCFAGVCLGCTATFRNCPRRLACHVQRRVLAAVTRSAAQLGASGSNVLPCKEAQPMRPCAAQLLTHSRSRAGRSGRQLADRYAYVTMCNKQTRQGLSLRSPQ